MIPDYTVFEVSFSNKHVRPVIFVYKVNVVIESTPDAIAKAVGAATEYLDKYLTPDPKEVYRQIHNYFVSSVLDIGQVHIICRREELAHE